MSVKELKNVDISSYTIITTGISTLISIIIAVLFVIGMVIAVPGSFSIIAYLIPTIVLTTLITSIFLSFSEGYLYNVLAKRLKNITLDIEDGYIRQVSTTSTALMTSLITLIIVLIIYLATSFLLPIVLSSMIQTLMFTGQNAVAYSLYQALIVISNPTVIIIGIIASFIVTFIFTLLGCYIYNILASKERGVKIELSKENNLTVIESVNPLSFAVAAGLISLILNIIIALIMLVSGADAVNAAATIVSGFISGFIGAALIAVFYNLLAPRIGKLKIELDD